MDFFRKVLASCLGTSIALIILTFSGFFLFGILVSSMDKDSKVIVTNNSVLEINLGSPVKDYVPVSDNPLDKLFDDDKLQLSSIINAIENAKYDDKIKINITKITKYTKR